MFQYNYFMKCDMNSAELLKHCKLKYGYDNVSKVPLVTIGILTYKRPQMLGIALNSAINQVGYNDYQIIIVDNAGISNEMSETEKVVRNINNDRILYYQQNEEFYVNNPQLHIANINLFYAISKSEWVCIMHDDDVLAPDYLRIMSQIVKSNPQIDYLSCKLNNLYIDEKNEYLMENFSKKRIDVFDTVAIYHIDEQESRDMATHYMLGAFLKRNKAIELGGYPVADATYGIEDTVFAIKYAYYFNAYHVDLPLYGYRVSATSSCARPEIMERIITERTHLARYVAKKMNLVFCYILSKNSDYNLIELIDMNNDANKNPYHVNYGINEERVLGEMHIVRPHKNRFQIFRRRLIGRLAQEIESINDKKNRKKNIYIKLE